MYEHIVAGVPGSGSAFIIPAQQVCTDIESIRISAAQVSLVYLVMSTSLAITGVADGISGVTPRF